MSEPDILEVWCLATIGSGKQLASIGQPFPVEVRPADNVHRLKRGAVGMSMLLRDTPIADFAALRPIDSESFSLSHWKDFNKKLSELGGAHKLEVLPSDQRIAHLGLEKGDIVIFSTLVQAFSSVSQGKDVSESPHLKTLHKDHRHLVMSAHQQGVVRDEDLKLSKVIEEENPEDPIRNFEKELESATSDSNNNAPSDSNDNTPPSLNDSALPSSDNAFSGSHDITMSDTNPEADNYKYTCSLAELHHLQMDCYDENLANAAIFFPFAFGLRRRPNFSFEFATFNWPFKMFIQVDEAVFSYNPRSDFLFTYGRLPQFIGEVQSQKNKADRNRMLLQAAYVVKFSNTLLKKHKVANDFRLLTAYINNNGEVERSIVYQDKGNDDEVKYTTPLIFDLNKRYELLAFLRELYNFASRMEREYSDEDLEDAQAEMEKLESESSTSARHPDVRAWTARPKTEDGSDSEPEQQKPADGGDEFIMQFKAEGYEVEPQVIGDGSVDSWELEGSPPPSRIWTVYKQSDVQRTNPQIAKRVHRSSSQELEILRYLHSRPSPSPYIITLEYHFTVGAATYLVFPKLNHVNDDSLRRRKIKQPCQSLVLGVAYLHMNGVAHLDLKPDNLLYDAAGQLKIIDFDVAVRVKDEEQEIEGYRGTPGWTAPEMGHEGGPKRRYSAIKADRWACGRILQAFLKYEPAGGLTTLVQCLMARDPSERPSLVRCGMGGLHRAGSV
ncbi:hypothetical protein H1R20_g7533, partial [Candolleomyces eurysporus]